MATVSEAFDAVVIGAGPAGALLAFSLARRRLRVALIERARFPRDKACGGCLHPRALALLDRRGLLDEVLRLGPAWVGVVEVHARGRSVRLALPRTLAVTRSALDAALARAAAAAGAHTRFGVRGSIENARVGGCLVRVGGESVIRARSVVAATGLGGVPLGTVPDLRPVGHRGSRVGVGGVIRGFAAGWPPRGELRMVFADTGYAGLVRAEGDRGILACALDPHALAAGPHAAVREVFLRADASVPDLPRDLEITPPLTRAPRHPAHDGVLCVGDAAGYVEPLTGEGMAWALQGADIAAREIERGIDASLARRYARALYRGQRRRRIACALSARLARHPGVLGLLLPWIARHDALARCALSLAHGGAP